MGQDEETSDSLFQGQIKVIQRKSGYRFSIDAVILAHFPALKERDVVLDLGCGCGVVSLIIAHRMPHVALYGIELQTELFELAVRNVALNGFEERITIRRGDLKEPENSFPASCADWVVCNPPYGRSSSGRYNSADEKALARHEIAASLPDIVKATRYFLKPHGRAAFIYPARRAAALISTMRQMRLEPKRLQIVYSRPGSKGAFVLIEAIKDGGEELLILPPFFIYHGPREYSQEMRRLYERGRQG